MVLQVAIARGDLVGWRFFHGFKPGLWHVAPINGGVSVSRGDGFSAKLLVPSMDGVPMGLSFLAALWI